VSVKYVWPHPKGNYTTITLGPGGGEGGNLVEIRKTYARRRQEDRQLKNEKKRDKINKLESTQAEVNSVM
jgi:hypothetical protein